MAPKLGTEVYDETEQYDNRHGRTTVNDEQKRVDLNPGSNKPPGQYTPFKITKQG